MLGLVTNFAASAQPASSFNYAHITFLTFQAVLEVVIVCLSGFWAATSGLLNNEATKMISRLNVDLFTPALIFTKLASSLSLKKLLEVIIIPILYAITTLVSYIASTFISRFLQLTEPETNFVTAMAVFGNSNSLPVSLTLALAYTLPGLEWDDIEGDNADKIASRGLVYLLIFQQLGQMLRWSWGFNTLLKRQPKEVIYYEGDGLHQDLEASPENENLLPPANSNDSKPFSQGYGSNGATGNNIVGSSNQSSNSHSETDADLGSSFECDSSSTEDSVRMLSSEQIEASNPNIDTIDNSLRAVRTISRTARGDIVVQIEDKDDSGNSDDDQILIQQTTPQGQNVLTPVPSHIQPAVVEKDWKQSIRQVYSGFIRWMNPPLWSMLCAIVVASIEPIRYQFYEADGFIQNTLAKGIRELGSVSIPLILVVLGANLAPSSEIPPACKHYSRMIFGSLISRMVLPSIVLLPIIVIGVKYIGLSIMDDPIFTITSFLLITSPPAIQLSQICQLNEIYQKEMAGVLFYGYVILTLPVTIFIVVTALQCVQWAQQ